MSKKVTVKTDFSQLKQQNEYIDKLKILLTEIYPEMPLAYVHSYGCQGNLADTERIKGILAEAGYGFTDDLNMAALVLYNTCAVREGAEDRIYGNVGALKHYKQRRRDMIIALCGCMMQQSEIADKIKNSFPHVDLVFGTYAGHKLPQMLYNAITSNKRVFDTEEGSPDIVEGMPVHRDGDIKAWVPIMYGCDNFCSYCIVPYVRGRERSRTSKDIVEEISGLVQNGYKEINLLGQNVNSYGKGLEDDINFSALLRRINDIDGEFRIRFMTSHPKDCTKELIDTMAECDKISKHLHLPVQSGSDRILELMNRKYSSSQYLELIEYAKERMPELSLTSDIIVGFPGETYEDFAKTMELIERVRYTSLFTFIYSKRSGTAAAEMEDPTAQEAKSKWFRQLLEKQGEIGLEVNKSYEGKTETVLVEGEGKLPGTLTGKTDSNIAAEFKGEKDLIGKFINVKITKARPAVLIGEIDN